ncbi:MAG: hypothetical protein K2X74_15565 [Acetobacteraceae bacterium]|nr:hypothetical protein [Acetobacteraceae bacterium]
MWLAAVLAGCAPWAPDPAPPPAAPAPSASFDGRWSATIRSTGSATGVNPEECAPEPRVTVEVRGGRFTYTQRLPRLSRETPSARDLASPVYEVTIAADGTMTGTADSGATLTGRASGGRMDANIYGLLCYYSFTAQRL